MTIGFAKAERGEQMSILIRGMEIPKDGCRGCVFVNRKWKGDICQILKREVTGNVERGGFQTDCPLVEIPPHGDLIDRDALLDSDGDLWDGMWGWSGVQIANAPTIIPADESDMDSFIHILKEDDEEDGMDSFIRILKD